MKQKLHERIVDRLVSVSRRHPGLKYPVLACIFVVLAFYHTGKAVLRRLPRLSVLSATALIFLLCASFSVPATDEAALAGDEVLPAEERVPEEQKAGTYIVSYEGTRDTKKNSGSAEKSPSENNAEREIPSVSNDTLVGADELLEGYEDVSEEKSSFRSEEELLASFDLSDWKLVLVNKQHPIPEDYEFELDVITGNFTCDARVLDSLRTMLSGARRDGITLYVCSPYRSSHTQILGFNKKIDNFMAEGMSYADAYRKASQAVTIPGCSEHEIGIAFDIVSDQYGKLNFGFGESEAGIWLAKHCAEYGFILRYPAGREDITGIEYEPWHFRYVGVDAACYITEHELTLEEFTELLKER
ncbi:MAG: M15 family metallopeptidase [Lachnospiraceae bacterium]|nr:M15 family metallopeptidase [Lachnospiraceae bacterium]